MSKIVDAYKNGWKDIIKWYKDGNEKNKIIRQNLKRELEKIDRETEEEMREYNKRYERFLNKDKTLELTLGEIFLWKILPLLFKILAILIFIVAVIFGGIYYILLGILIFGLVGFFIF